MKAKTIQLFWLHIANRNDSILGDYLNTLDENMFSPYLQFTDEEVDILKTIHEEYAHAINTKRNQIRVINKNTMVDMKLFFIINRQYLTYFYLNCTLITTEVIRLTNFSSFHHFFSLEILYTMFRYPALEVNVRFFDFVFME